MRTIIAATTLLLTAVACTSNPDLSDASNIDAGCGAGTGGGDPALTSILGLPEEEARTEAQELGYEFSRIVCRDLEPQAALTYPNVERVELWVIDGVVVSARVQ